LLQARQFTTRKYNTYKKEWTLWPAGPYYPQSPTMDEELQMETETCLSLTYHKFTKDC